MPCGSRARLTAYVAYQNLAFAEREVLLAALADVPEERWAQSPGPAYSPVGWHLGHVASVQARWLLPGEERRYGDFFDPQQTAKPSRRELPPSHGCRLRAPRPPLMAQRSGQSRPPLTYTRPPLQQPMRPARVRR